MGVISVRLDNDTEARLKREATAQGMSFSDFLRERLTGETKEQTNIDWREFADMLDGNLQQICNFLNRMEREQGENAYFTQTLIYNSMRMLMPKSQESIKKLWSASLQKAREHTNGQEGKSS